MKKVLSIVLALAMVLSLVGSCFAESVALTVWVGANEDIEWINGVIDGFKAAHPENEYTISVDVVSEGNAKASVLADPEAAADVFTFADDQFNELLAAGALQEVLDADVVIAENGGAEAGAVAAASDNGTLYAFPATASNGYFMFYNKAYFTAEDVQTLDRMMEVAASQGKKVGFPMSNAWYLYGFFRGCGLDMHSDDGIVNVCNWNATDTAITGVQIAEALLAITANPGFVNADSDPFVAGVKDGSIIAGVSGTWNASAAMEVWGDDYAAVKLPTFTVNGEQVQIGSFAGYKMVGVNAFSPAVFDALDFAAYMTAYEAQVSRFELRAEGPTNAEAAASEAVLSAPAIAALAAQSAYADVQRVGGQYWAPGEALGQILVNGNPDGTDLQTLLDNAVAGITAAPIE